MPSITTWTRLEPRSRQEDMSAFLRAQVADPLWNLAVQWRIGEFTGEDAAFPIAAAYQVTVRPLVPVAAAADPQLPADALLGAESPAQPGTASAADNGAELLQQLADHAVSTAGITAIVAAHPFTTAATDVADPQGASYLRLLSGRIPDGDSWEPLLRAATAPGGTLPAGAGVPASDTTAVLAAATVWLAALDARQPPGGQSWQAETLEYQFSVPVASAVGTFATAQAPTWDGDELDWYHFDLVAGSEAPPTYPVLPGVDPTTGTISGVGVPHPLSYPGAPDPRYWAMEDANVSFPDVQVGVADLARMLVVEFATVTAPNWYLQPLPLPTGGVHTVSLTVTNTFGETTAVPMLATSLAGPGQTPSSVPDWVMFRPTTSTDDGGTAPLDGLLLPSLSIDDLRSAPVESVALVRDDSADRAWALETTVLGGDSRPVDRYSASTAASTQPPARASRGRKHRTLPARLRRAALGLRPARGGHAGPPARTDPPRPGPASAGRTAPGRPRSPNPAGAGAAVASHADPPAPDVPRPRRAGARLDNPSVPRRRQRAQHRSRLRPANLRYSA